MQAWQERSLYCFPDVTEIFKGGLTQQVFEETGSQVFGNCYTSTVPCLQSLSAFAASAAA